MKFDEGDFPINSYKNYNSKNSSNENFQSDYVNNFKANIEIFRNSSKEDNKAESSHTLSQKEDFDLSKNNCERKNTPKLSKSGILKSI